MPRLSEKGLVILSIWAGAIVMGMITFLGKDVIGIWEFVHGITYVGCASGATISIVEKWGSSPPVEAVEQAARGKAKRSDLTLVERLVDSLSEEEMHALRERLSIAELGSTELGADGELVAARADRRN